MASLDLFFDELKTKVQRFMRAEIDDLVLDKEMPEYLKQNPLDHPGVATAPNPPVFDDQKEAIENR